MPPTGAAERPTEPPSQNVVGPSAARLTVMDGHPMLTVTEAVAAGGQEPFTVAV